MLCLRGCPQPQQKQNHRAAQRCTVDISRKLHTLQPLCQVGADGCIAPIRQAAVIARVPSHSETLPIHHQQVAAVPRKCARGDR